MGLKVDPCTNEIDADFNIDHIAIDCIIYLVGKLEPYLTEMTRKDSGILYQICK